MFPVVVRLFVVRAGISATCGVDFSSGAPHLSGWSARGGDPISDGFSSANTHLVCFLVREHRELLERAGQRGASRARVRLVRNVHGGARQGVCSSGTDWFSVAGGASVTTAVRGGGWLGRSARRGGGGRERQTAARSRAFAVPRRARPSSNPDVLAARRVRKRSRFGWMAFAGDALPANASWPRVDARSASIARLTRACECRSGPRRRTGVATERRRPGPGLGENDARRVLCGKHTGGGATVADVTRVPVVFAVRVIEDYELCRVSRVSRRRTVFLSRDSRATASVGLESRSVKRESGRGR
jgi:hypothetical protein